MNAEPEKERHLKASAGAEAERLQEDALRQKNWKRWGPYLSERQWGTVREDYSANGTCWEYFPHDHARSRAYRWGEDGLLGITDREERLCFALALWNGRDPILKERLFGLTSDEGNHGEDVKEEYFYLDSTPTHSYMKGLYKYPQAEFPYLNLVEENKRRDRTMPEYELADTGVFKESRYFDVQAEYAKNTPDDILIRITVSNRGPEAATLHLLPTIWFRNTWVWECAHEGCTDKPCISVDKDGRLVLTHQTLGQFFLEAGPDSGGKRPQLLFTENETNFTRLYGVDNGGSFVKDAFHEYIIRGSKEAVNGSQFGTKAAVYYVISLKPGESQTVRLRLYPANQASVKTDAESMDRIFALRLREADEFYSRNGEGNLNDVERNVVRQAYAGLLWTKQFYHFIVEDWLEGDPGQPRPPEGRKSGRDSEWKHLYSRDVLSMPDNWEYPWFAAWDLAFHTIPFARIDGRFAKKQLGLLLREWYMHPNGQIPAYEFEFSDVNPPVHAWAACRVYKIADKKEERDRDFLESIFQKLLLNFTWWVNRKDPDGKNLFAGGFLGLDNVGVFDRSKPLPEGGTLRQADGTAWMASYCSTMLAIALELAHGGGKVHKAYEDMASKFLEHFVQIADAMNTLGGTGLWDETDGFYYDQIKINGQIIPLKTRSIVGLMPLVAVEVMEEEKIKGLPGFYKRFQWFQQHRKDLQEHISHCVTGVKEDKNRYFLLAIPKKERLVRMLGYMLDENEFLSPFGLRSLSKFHEQHPYVFEAGGIRHQVDYEPAESRTGTFGGNSNWRGPVWFPANFLLIEALERYHHFFGDDLKVECPTGSGKKLTLKEIARELQGRLAKLFLPDQSGDRPCNGGDARYSKDPNWKNYVLFHEYFHGENGKGLGASHQTGWTALAINTIEDLARRRKRQADQAKAKGPK
jgi:hypothetical protein